MAAAFAGNLLLGLGGLIGASLPSFATAFVLAAIARTLARRRVILARA